MNSTREILDALTQYLNYPIGWHYGSGIPAGTKTVELGRQFVEQLKDVYTDNFHVSLSDGGIIVFSFRVRSRFFEVLICHEDPIELFIETNGVEECEHYTFDSLIDLIKFISPLWVNLYESYVIASTLYPKKIDMQVLHSYPTRVGFLYSKKNAQLKHPMESANTLSLSIHPLFQRI